MTKFRFLTAGESHGMGLTVILEGIPSNLSLSEEYIRIDMSRRQKGYGSGGRMKIEKDSANIKSGVRHGKTLGSPGTPTSLSHTFRQNACCLKAAMKASQA